MNRPRIVVVGSSNTDMIIRVERIPRPGETILGGEFATAAGGKGANQAVAAARAGGNVAFCAKVGTDVFGEQAMAGFVRDGINVEHVGRDSGAASGVALIFVARDGENSIGVASGANARLAPEDIDEARPAFEGAGTLLMQLETPLETVLAAAEQAEKIGLQVILNPAPAQPLPDRLLRRVSILTPNETEAELLTGIPVMDEAGAIQAAQALHGRGVTTVVITLGARGCLVSTAGAAVFVPGFPVSAVDTTAAGDIFNGALAVALGEGQPILEAARFACAAAAISVTCHGAQPSAPARAEIEQLLKVRVEGAI